jgi:acetyl-CoA carboxylase biotin carboxylase subunit
MRRTLEMTVIEGIKTNVPLHLKILAEADFADGRLSTAFMNRFMPAPSASRILAEAV